jgi:hypothetical protein
VDLPMIDGGVSAAIENWRLAKTIARERSVSN